MNTQKINVKFVSPFDEEISKLVLALDVYQKSLYPPESNHLVSKEELSAPDFKMIGAYRGEQAIGIGACKFFNSYAEIKRFFILPEYRKLGIATLLIQELEKLIMLADLPLSRLETGIYQPEALSFYKKRGYRLRDHFGAYKKDSLSVFMEKIII